MEKKNMLCASCKKHGVVFALLALILAAALLFAEFASYGNVTNILNQNSMIGIISLGMTFVILTGGIDLSVGSLAALSSVLTAVLSPKGSLAIMFLVPLAVCTAMGLLSGLIIAKLQIAPFITTLGMMMAARGIALVMTDGGVSVSVDTGLAETFRLFARSYLLWIPTPVWLFVILLLAGLYIARWTRPGRYIYAVGGNEEAARMMGLQPEKIKIAVYTANGLLAGLAGLILASRLGAGQPVVGR